MPLPRLSQFRSVLIGRRLQCRVAQPGQPIHLFHGIQPVANTHAVAFAAQSNAIHPCNLCLRPICTGILSAFYLPSANNWPSIPLLAPLCFPQGERNPLEKQKGHVCSTSPQRDLLFFQRALTSPSSPCWPSTGNPHSPREEGRLHFFSCSLSLRRP